MDERSYNILSEFTEGHDLLQSAVTTATHLERVRVERGHSVQSVYVDVANGNLEGHLVRQTPTLKYRRHLITNRNTSLS